MHTSLLCATSPVGSTKSNWQQALGVLEDKTWYYEDGRTDKHVTKKMEVNWLLLVPLYGGVFCWQKCRGDKVISFSLAERQEYLVDKKTRLQNQEAVVVWTFSLDHLIHLNPKQKNIKRCLTPTCAIDCHVIWQIQTFFLLSPMAFTARHMPLSINI